MSRQGRRLLILLVVGCALVPAGGAAARVSTAPFNYAFPGQTVGTSSGPVTFTLTVSCNLDPAQMVPTCDTNDPLTPNVTVSGNFAIQNNNCTALMPGNTPFGTSCTFGVAFAPQSVGSHAGIVDVGEPIGFGRAGVTGTGLAPVLPATTTGTPLPGKAKKCKRRRGTGKAAAARKCKRKR